MSANLEQVINPKHSRSFFFYGAAFFPLFPISARESFGIPPDLQEQGRHLEDEGGQVHILT